MAAETTIPSSSKPKKKKQDLVSKRNQPLARIWRFVRATWLWALLAWVIYTASQDREFLNGLLIVLEQVGRLVLLLSFSILQFVAIFWFMARSKTEIIRPEDPKSLTFEDYKGQPQLLKLVRQWISLLSDRSKFQAMGGQFINGLLLYGPPGTGKTMLAKCMAGEAGVAFMSIEGSGFRAMFWGVDVLKMIAFVRKARKLAREYGACIAFIDEIDAVGGSRGGVMGGRTPLAGGAGMGLFGGGGTGALTRLLYEMDGVEEKTRFEKLQAWYYTKILRQPAPKRNWHVLFMGSTNRPDSLDAALIRPGRFDRMIAVEHPDRTGRRAIIEYYLSKIKHDATVDVEAIVSDTPGYTPAQIMAAITKDAVRLAIFDNRSLVSQRDIDMAFQEQASGLENPIEELEDIQREQIAYHEAGHAVAIYHLFPDRRIVRATIIRRSGSLGHVRSVENVEKYARPLKEYVKQIMVSLSGDIATRIRFNEPWTGMAGGYGSDYSMVRSLLFALFDSGYFGPPVDDPMRLYANEIKSFWEDAASKTERLLREYWPQVDAIAKALIQNGDLSGAEVNQILRGLPPSNGHRPEEIPAVVLDTVAEKRENGHESTPVEIHIPETQSAN
ncbi:MAG: AAA family ATPase [Anaerolineales bacterium]